MAELWPGLGGPTISYISRPPSKKWRRAWPRKLVILGSTGSIGQSALAVVESKREDFCIIGLSCARNVKRLAAQAERFRPSFLGVLDAAAAYRLNRLLPKGYSPCILEGHDGYAALASLPDAATVLTAQVGSAGLAGTLAAALAGKVICLANKESLVLAGDLVRAICKRTHAVILPVDSEHNAIFQCLAGRGQEAASLVLTASGGPFLGKTKEELHNVTVEQALKHPTWRMGAKISIDSATLMNKGLEILEAFHLYGVDPSRIRVLIHPQSVVHSLVELTDGSLLAQMGAADMRLALAHCLLWPRCEPAGAIPLNPAQAGALTFHEPDTQTFSCLTLARRALKQRGGLNIVINAANEAAVELFLQGRIRFADIPRLIEAAMWEHTTDEPGAHFSPPLTAKRFPALTREVHLLQQHIERLDRQSRNVVNNMANDGEQQK